MEQAILKRVMVMCFTLPDFDGSQIAEFSECGFDYGRCVQESWSVQRVDFNHHFSFTFEGSPVPE
jgi:hypothetical protein